MGFTSGLTVGAVHSVGLDKHVMTGPHHYDVTQRSVTALNTLCAPCLHVSSLPTPGNRRSFHCLCSSAFSRMSQSWALTLCSLFKLASATSAYACKDFLKQKLNIRFKHREQIQNHVSPLTLKGGHSVFLTLTVKGRVPLTVCKNVGVFDI